MTRTSRNTHPAEMMDLGSAYFEDLASAHGTPYYLYDLDRFADRVSKVRTAFEGVPHVFFAMKANPNLGVLKTIRPIVDGLDISSGGELAQAMLAGYDPANLSFAGPAKTVVELTESIKNQVGAISVESVRELTEIVRLARELGGARANVVLRVNPKADSGAYRMRMGGRAVQFGVDEEELGSIAELVARSEDVVNFLGIHVYAGSQGFVAENVAAGITDSIRIAEEFEANTGLSCRKLNLGGGFGVTTGDDPQMLSLAKLARLTLDPMRDFLESGRQRRELIFELGRYLIADAGVYIVRVIDIKVSQGKSFVVVDGGLNHHLAAAGMFGVGIRSNYMLGNLSRPSARPVECNIAGPSCNPTDLLGVSVRIPKPEEGDLIAVFRSGSYGFSASPILFLGRNTPTELIRYAGSTTVGRESLDITSFN